MRARPVNAGRGERAAADPPEGVSSLGHGLAAAGEIRAAEHLIIEGSFDGRILNPAHDVAIGRGGSQSGELRARHVTVLGRAAGRLVADRIEIADGATVEGQLLAGRLVIADGAVFQGTINLAETDAGASRRESEPGRESAP